MAALKSYNTSTGQWEVIAVGYTGSIGYAGSKGDVGFTGSQGIAGAYAALGYTGSRGVSGYTGSVGYAGSTGFTGSQGYDGSAGFTGSVGYVGSTGFVGSAGFTGSLGFTGSSGVGYTGSAGAGYTGSQGIPGAFAGMGYTGSAGSSANLTVSLINAANTVSNILTNIDTIRFDSDAGFDVTSLSTGTVKIGMNSTFKYWEVAGQETLVAQGLDTIKLVAGSNITLQTNTGTNPKQLTISASVPIGNPDAVPMPVAPVVA